MNRKLLSRIFKRTRTLNLRLDEPLWTLYEVRPYLIISWSLSSLNWGTPPGSVDIEILWTSEGLLNWRIFSGAVTSENGSQCTCVETVSKRSIEPAAGKSETCWRRPLKFPSKLPAEILLNCHEAEAKYSATTPQDVIDNGAARRHPQLRLH